MEALNQPNRPKLFSFPRYIIAVGAALLLFSTTAVYADGPYTMAPPIQPAQDESYGPSSDTANVSADTVFNWNEVPENQQVPIQRAVFDQGGYQLYDNVGETIVVPFTDNNLYVMKFAVSPDNTMFFVNDGTAPTLYVPRDGYLENATVSGAKWYPFSEDFHPAEPVFLGCAPSWTAFISMGWYPGMICHGGFWCGVSFWDGGIFTPCVDLTFIIGGHSCFGWRDFDDFCGGHPDFVHVGFFHPQVYRFADRPHFGDHPFAGGHAWNGNNSAHFGVNRGNSNEGHNGSFNGQNGRTWSNEGHSSGFNGQSGRSWTNEGSTTHHVFQGANGGSVWNGNRNNDNPGSGDRSFGGSQHSTFQGGGSAGDRNFSSGSGRVFRGGDTSNGGSSSWGNRSSGGQSDSGTPRVFSGGNTNWSGRSGGGQSDAAPARVFGGGGSNGGGNRSFGGGSSGWSGRSSGGSSGGGDRSSGADRSGGSRDSGSDRSGGNNSGGNGGGGRNGGGGGGWGR